MQSTEEIGEQVLRALIKRLTADVTFRRLFPLLQLAHATLVPIVQSRDWRQVCSTVQAFAPHYLPLVQTAEQLLSAEQQAILWDGMLLLLQLSEK